MGAAVTFSHDDIDTNSIQTPQFGHDDIDVSSIKEPPKTSASKSFSDNMANTSALGYGPQLVGAITKFLSPSKENIASVVRPDIAAKADKNNISYNPYLIGRDTASQTLSQENADHPTASLAGGLTGAIGSGVLTPLPKALMASGITGGLVKGGLVGAGYGALSNPGDTEGQIDPVQYDARKQNAITGGEIGAVTGGVTQGISKGLNAVANSPETLQNAAKPQAIKASGAMLKDFRALNGANRTDQLGQFALDNGLVKAGDTFEDVGAKADALKRDAGARLDEIYSRAKTAMPTDKAASAVPAEVGFNPIRDKEAILSKVKDQLGDQVGSSSAVNAVGTYLDELGQKYGNKVLDPKAANNIESAVSKKVNFLRNPLTASPEAEQGFNVLRSHVSDAVDNHIAYLSEINDPQIADKLAAANKDYGFAKQISSMAKDKAQRMLANSKFGLLDTIASAGGATAGAIAGEEMGGHPIEGGLVGIGAGILGHYARGHGDSILASGLNRAGQAMSYGPAQAAQLASRINPNLVSRAITQNGATNNMNTVQQLNPQAAPMQNDPNMTPTQTKPADPKGPDKWAGDGLQNLKGHVGDDDRKMLEDNKGAMLLDPKTKQLLITASNFKPGSKPLDDIVKHIKNRLGEK